MSANIFGERFLGRSGPAWHELGITDPKIRKATTAVKKAGLDYKIFMAPIAGQVETPMGTQLVQVPDKHMIMREPTADDPEYRMFGFASPDYPIIQNMDLAKTLDRLTDAWPLETAGALGKGETVFFTLDAGQRDVKGESVRQFFLVTDTRDGGTSMKIAFTPVRVVCQNTLVTGLRESLVSLSMQHTTGLETSFEARINLIKKMEAARDNIMSMFDTLAKFKMGKNDFQYVVGSAYPMPKKPAKVHLLDEFTDEDDIAEIGALYEEAIQANAQWAYYCSRVQVFRDGATHLYEKFNDEFPKTAGTAWAAFNAIVECADWRDGSESVAVSALFGPRAAEKKRAFKAIQSIIAK